MTEAIKKQILFVDDEPLLLKGLQRSLRKMRNEWDMTFASGGKEALDILSRQSLDVIVSDLKMPEMDGTQLLAKVKKQYPQVVRIILSGHVEHDMTIKAVQLAHQSIPKPCEADILKQTLAKLFALRDVLTDESIKKIVSQIASLPSIPSVYTAIIEEMNSEKPSIKNVGDIISQDIGMTAKILQVVNSVFFGLSRKINNAQDAVMLLGLETIKSLVLSVKIFSEFSKKKFSWFDIDGLFAHSMSVSTYAKAIAKSEKLNQDLLNNSLMAGLLHDLGKLILVTNFPELYKEMLVLAERSGQDPVDMEYEAFGTSHAEIGAYLMGLWSLETPIIEAIAFHHFPSKSLTQEVGLLTAVHIGNALDHERQADSAEESNIRYDIEYLETLGEAERLPEWCQVCKASIERAA